MRRWIAIPLVILALTGAARSERLKDIVEIKGVRSNPIWGYGLVVGLNGTGDDSETSRRAMANILRRQGMVLKPEDVKSKNIASVIVTAELPPFGRAGTRIDVTISVIGNANSLQGGTLLLTPMVGADGEVYAVAQGPISVGGFSAGGASASVSKNHPTVGRIPNGATIEREELATYVEDGEITLQLRNADFTTAERVAKVINGLAAGSAHATDAGAVVVRLPEDMTPKDVTGFVDKIGVLEVKVDQPALVVINERTGTIVVGESVTISTVAITHGSLSIKTKDTEKVHQPPPLAPRGSITVTTTDTQVEASEEKRALRVVPKQLTVAELARALNAMGLTPRDLIAIFQALRQAGALQANLKIM